MDTHRTSENSLDEIARLAESVRAIQDELKARFDIDHRQLEALITDTMRLGDYLDRMPVGREVTSAGSVSSELSENLRAISKRIGASDDVVVREFNVGGKQNLRAALVYIDGLSDREAMHRDVLQPLMLLNHSLMTFETPITPEAYVQLIRDHSLTVADIKDRGDLSECINFVLSGDTLLLVDGVALGMVISIRNWEHRGVEEPSTESVIRGPRDGFTETLRVNTMLLRRRIRDSDLRIVTLKVGRRTRTDVSIVYLEGVANVHLVSETIRRVQAIDTDAILESGYIEQYIEDDQFSPFPQVHNTERPTKLSGYILEGRVGILVDGTPFALVVPATFNQFYQSPDDYNERWGIGTLIRFVRMLAIFASLTVTSLYVALISYHPEMIPTRFAVAVAGGRSGIPFPSIVEALLMEMTMEILREASLRLPRQIGPTISIVGALVIGEAATKAGIVSPLMVIVVAVTTIGSFAIPSFSSAIALRILRFPVIIAAGVFGLYGVMIALILITIHLASLKSFGIPYLSPFTPARPADFSDTVVRAPFYFMPKRPTFLRPRDTHRLPHGAELIKGTKERQDREEH